MKVAFYKGKSKPFNIITSWWLRGSYSHCELIIGEDSSGRSICASSSFMDSGVRIKHIKLNPESWDVIEVEGDIAFALAWLDAHEGQSYDVPGLLGFIFRRIGHKQDRWVCSEAVAAMLGVVDPWRFDPCNLYAALEKRYK